jgi:hypothetical protein
VGYNKCGDLSISVQSQKRKKKKEKRVEEVTKERREEF